MYVVQDATRGVEEGTTVSAVREMKDQGQLRSGHAPQSPCFVVCENEGRYKRVWRIKRYKTWSF